MSRLRTVIVTQEDPFYIAEFFRTFVADARRQGGPADIVSAWILDTLGQSSPLGLARRLYGLYGPRDFPRLAYRYAKLRSGSLIFDRIHIGEPRTVAQILNRAGITVQRSFDINAPDSLAAIERLQPDVLLSISATQKFGPELLSLPRLGCFNSHSGALPRFRGMMPTFWTLYEDQHHATVTVHKMAPQLDDGAIWRQEHVPLHRNLSLNDVILQTKRLSARMMWTLLEELAAGPVPLQRNDASQRSYYKFPTAEDAAELRRRGWRLL